LKLFLLGFLEEGENVAARDKKKRGNPTKKKNEFERRLDLDIGGGAPFGGTGGKGRSVRSSGGETDFAGHGDDILRGKGNTPFYFGDGKGPSRSLDREELSRNPLKNKIREIE